MEDRESDSENNDPNGSSRRQSNIKEARFYVRNLINDLVKDTFNQVSDPDQVKDNADAGQSTNGVNNLLVVQLLKVL